MLLILIPPAWIYISPERDLEVPLRCALRRASSSLGERDEEKRRHVRRATYVSPDARRRFHCITHLVPEDWPFDVSDE